MTPERVMEIARVVFRMGGYPARLPASLSPGLFAWHVPSGGTPCVIDTKNYPSSEPRFDLITYSSEARHADP